VVFFIEKKKSDSKKETSFYESKENIFEEKKSKLEKIDLINLNL